GELLAPPPGLQRNEQCASRVQRSQAGNAHLHGCSTNCQRFPFRPFLNRRRVDQEIDLAAADQIQEVWLPFVNLVHGHSSNAVFVEKSGRTARCIYLISKTGELTDDSKRLGL